MKGNLKSFLISNNISLTCLVASPISWLVSIKKLFKSFDNLAPTSLLFANPCKALTDLVTNLDSSSIPLFDFLSCAAVVKPDCKLFSRSVS